MKSMKIRPRMISSILSATAAVAGSTAQLGFAQVIGTVETGATSFQTILAGMGRSSTPVSFSSDVSAYDVIFVNTSYGHSMQLYSTQIAAWVSAGGVLVVHDRDVAASSSWVPGVAAVAVFGSDLNRAEGASRIVDGSFGAVTDTSLDGGNFSSHGYVFPVPPVATIGLVDASGRAVTVEYPYGAGRVCYSTIPLDFYIVGAFPLATSMQIYAKNLAERMIEHSTDCNGNGIEDATDIANHTASDCNGNGKLDSCDIASGAELDLNADGFPDSCQSAIVSWGDNTNGQRNAPSGVGFVSAIDGGWNHTVALRGNGTVVCWGSNSFGQCTPPVGLSSVLAISAGQGHTVALKSDGTVVAWGAIYNENGVYGALPTPPAGLSGVVAIASGSDHMLALKSNGQLVGWGSNVDWDDTGATIGQATVPADLVSATAIGAGYMHSLAVRPDGTVRCFGWNSQGQSQPTAGLSSVVRVAGGLEHSLALKSDGTVVAWG
jgi:hypothetical protein